MFKLLKRFMREEDGQEFASEHSLPLKILGTTGSSQIL